MRFTKQHMEQAKAKASAKAVRERNSQDRLMALTMLLVGFMIGGIVQRFFHFYG